MNSSLKPNYVVSYVENYVAYYVDEIVYRIKRQDNNLQYIKLGSRMYEKILLEYPSQRLVFVYLTKTHVSFPESGSS